MSLRNKANILLDDGVNTLEFTPKSYNIKFESLADENSGRADSGAMSINWVINKITKLEIELPPYALNDGNYSAVLNFVQGKILDVTYFDSMELKERTTKMYCSNSSVSWNTSAVRTGIVKDGKFDLIEMDGETIIPIPVSSKVGPFDYELKSTWTTRSNFYGIEFIQNSENATAYNVSITGQDFSFTPTYNAPVTGFINFNSSMPSTPLTLNVSITAVDGTGTLESRTVTKTVNYGGQLPQPTNVRRENCYLKWDYPNIPGTLFVLSTNSHASDANTITLTTNEYEVLSEQDTLQERYNNTNYYYIHAVNPSYKGASQLNTEIYCGRLHTPTNFVYDSTTRVLTWDPVPYAHYYYISPQDSQGLGPIWEDWPETNSFTVPEYVSPGHPTARVEVQALEVHNLLSPTRSEYAYFYLP